MVPAIGRLYICPGNKTLSNPSSGSEQLNLHDVRRLINRSVFNNQLTFIYQCVVNSKITWELPHNVPFEAKEALIKKALIVGVILRFLVSSQFLLILLKGFLKNTLGVSNNSSGTSGIRMIYCHAM